MFAFLLFFPGSLLYVAIWPPLQILGLILPATMVLFIVLNPIWECQDCKLTWPAREFKNQK